MVDNPEAVADLLRSVEEGDRLTLTLETPDGEEETRVVKTVISATETPLDPDEPASGNVEVWVRDLSRVDPEEEAATDTGKAAYAAVRFRPHGRGPPPIRLHGHTAAPEAEAGIEFLGEVERAVVDEEAE